MGSPGLGITLISTGLPGFCKGFLWGFKGLLPGLVTLGIRVYGLGA